MKSMPAPHKNQPQKYERRALYRAFVRRQKKHQVQEDALQFLWAVSYSDLLMVLLSFFVIYSELSQSSKDNPKNRSTLESILLAFKGDGAKPAAPKPKLDAEEAVDSKQSGNGVAQSADKKSNKPGQSLILTEIIARVSKDGSVAVEANMGSVVINLPPNIFRPGQMNLDAKVRRELGHVLDIIVPFSEQVSISIVGHTDEVPVSALRNKKIVDSNLVLSNLRATKAVEFAVSNGFDPRWVSSEGVAEHRRNTRSLSLRITERIAVTPEVKQK